MYCTLRCTVRALSTIVILLEKPTWTRAPYFLFPLVLPSQTTEFWLGSSGSWTHCFLQLVPCIAPTRAPFCSGLHRNQRHQWDQYQDWPALPVWIQCSRKFANSPSSPPLISHYHGVERSRSVSGFAASHRVHRTAHRLFIICLQSLWDRSISSLTNHQPLRLPSLAVCVWGGGQLVALRFLAEDCEKQVLPRGRH